MLSIFPQRDIAILLKSLLMTGFEPRIAGVEWNLSAYCAATTALNILDLEIIISLL